MLFAHILPCKPWCEFGFICVAVERGRKKYAPFPTRALLSAVTVLQFVVAFMLCASLPCTAGISCTVLKNSDLLLNDLFLISIMV